MFTREEKRLLLEAIRLKLQRAAKDLHTNKHYEVVAKKQKRIETLIQLRAKIINSKEIEKE